MRKKKQNLNKTNLKKLNSMAHLKSFPSKIKSISSDYQDLNIFIKDFENFISTELKVPSKDLSTQDKIFEGIINRLDFLNDYKNITLRIYLESQKKPKYFLNIRDEIIKDFKFKKEIIDECKSILKQFDMYMIVSICRNSHKLPEVGL